MLIACDAGGSLRPTVAKTYREDDRGAYAARAARAVNDVSHCIRFFTLPRVTRAARYHAYHHLL